MVCQKKKTAKVDVLVVFRHCNYKEKYFMLDKSKVFFFWSLVRTENSVIQKGLVWKRGFVAFE